MRRRVPPTYAGIKLPKPHCPDCIPTLVLSRSQQLERARKQVVHLGTGRRKRTACKEHTKNLFGVPTGILFPNRAMRRAA